MFLFEEIIQKCEELIPSARMGGFVWYAPHEFSHYKKVRDYIVSIFTILHGRYPEPAETAILFCAAALHDVGMFLLPSEINRLHIHAERFRIYGKRGEEMVYKYPQFFTGCVKKSQCTIAEAGVVKINTTGSDAEYAAAIAESEERQTILKFVREAHPVISQVYIEKNLTEKLKDVVSPEVAREFAELVGLVVAMHGKEASYSGKVRGLWGYQYDINKLGDVLVVADALDLTRHVDDMRISTTLCYEFSQVKHLIFKKAVKKVDFRRGIEIQLTTNADKGQILGVIYFEVGQNFAKDYIRVVERYNKMPIYIIRGNREILLNVENLKALNDDAKKLEKSRFYAEFESLEGSERLTEYFTKCGIHNTGENIKKILEEADPFDILAISLALGLPTDGFIRLAKDLKTWNLVKSLF